MADEIIQKIRDRIAIEDLPSGVEMIVSEEANQFSDCPVFQIWIEYEDVKGKRAGTYSLTPTVDDTIDFAVSRLVQQMHNGLEIYPLKAKEEPG